MQDAQTTFQPAITEREPNLFLRSDTFLGICEGLGEDLGFNPLPLRIALAAGLLWNPAAIVGIYLGLGVIVLASRLLFPPVCKPALAAEGAPAEAAAEPAPVEADEEERELIAA